MRLVVQRTKCAEVVIGGESYSRTGPGLLILFGTRQGDIDSSCAWLADKVVNLRIFEDDDDKMDLSALDVGAELMVVSQFTLYADCRKGRRPSYNQAQEPVEAEQLYDRFVDLIGQSGLTVRTGQFGARMDVKLTNAGPVTIILEHDA